MVLPPPVSPGHRASRFNGTDYPGEESDLGGVLVFSDCTEPGEVYTLKYVKNATATAFSSERLFNIWMIFHHTDI